MGEEEDSESLSCTQTNFEIYSKQIKEIPRKEIIKIFKCFSIREVKEAVFCLNIPKE